MMAKRRQVEKKKMGHCVGGCEGGCWSLLSSHPQDDRSRFSVDSGQECRLRHDDTAPATISGLREAHILNILWLFQAQKDDKTDLAHLEAHAH